jgi:hypothetical protein
MYAENIEGVYPYWRFPQPIACRKKAPASALQNSIYSLYKGAIDCSEHNSTSLSGSSQKLAQNAVFLPKAKASGIHISLIAVETLMRILDMYGNFIINK